MEGSKLLSKIVAGLQKKVMRGTTMGFLIGKPFSRPVECFCLYTVYKKVFDKEAIVLKF